MAAAELRLLRHPAGAQRRKVLAWLRFAASPTVASLLTSAPGFRERWAWADDARALMLCASLFEGPDWSLAGRVLQHFVCDATLRALGTARHDEVRDALRAGRLAPAYAHAEVGGGVTTRAVYDRRLNVFRLSSPSAASAKVHSERAGC